MAETIVEWHPIEGINAPCAAIEVYENDGELTLTLRFSAVVDGLPSDLRLSFGRVIAFMTHEESAHPWNDTQREQPRLSGKWSSYTFPCLEVLHSSWISSFGESRLFGLGPQRHLQVITLDKTVDVLATAPVHAQWLVG